MLESHPLLIEKESYKVKYLNVLEYFSRKYSANDSWANQTLQLYIKKVLGTKNSYKYDNFDLQRNTKPVLATKFRPFKFFSYRYCLIIDCIFISGRPVLQFSNRSRANGWYTFFCTVHQSAQSSTTVFPF